MSFTSILEFIKHHNINIVYTNDGNLFCGNTLCNECKITNTCREYGARLTDDEVQRFKIEYPEYFL